MKKGFGCLWISKMEPPARIELATSTFSALCDTKVALSA